MTISTIRLIYWPRNFFIMKRKEKNYERTRRDHLALHVTTYLAVLRDMSEFITVSLSLTLLYPVTYISHLRLYIPLSSPHIFHCYEFFISSSKVSSLHTRRRQGHARQPQRSQHQRLSWLVSSLRYLCSLWELTSRLLAMKPTHRPQQMHRFLPHQL